MLILMLMRMLVLSLVLVQVLMPCFLLLRTSGRLGHGLDKRIPTARFGRSNHR